MLNTAIEIYGSFQDSESKEVFKNRLLYSITNEKKYVNNLVQRRLHHIIEAIERGEGKKYLEKLLKMVEGKHIIIYGVGYYGLLYKTIIEKESPSTIIVGFCDKKLCNEKNIYNYPAIKREELGQFSGCSILLSPKKHRIRQEITEELYKMGISDEMIICDAPLFPKYVDKIYFDDCIKSRLIENKEIFLDAGCYDCQSAIDFIDACPKYEYIFSMEPDSANVTICKDIAQQMKIRNIKIIQEGLWSKNTNLSFSSTGESARVSEKGTEQISVTTIDDMYMNIQKEFTYIKMDIEGAELQALIGGEAFIKKFCPKLAISVYHKKEDILSIPAYLHKIVPQYKFVLRHYGLSECDTVLYAFVD